MPRINLYSSPIRRCAHQRVWHKLNNTREESDWCTSAIARSHLFSFRRQTPRYHVTRWLNHASIHTRTRASGDRTRCGGDSGGGGPVSRFRHLGASDLGAHRGRESPDRAQMRICDARGRSLSHPPSLISAFGPPPLAGSSRRKNSIFFIRRFNRYPVHRVRILSLLKTDAAKDAFVRIKELWD